MANPKKPSSHFLWGPIESIETAQKARLPSLCFSAFSAAAWVMIALNGLFSPNPYGYWAILYAVILSLVAWGLYKMRKEAAIVAMVIALTGLLSGGGTLKILADAVMLFVAVAAIRGTLAYSLLIQQEGASKR